ncbi:Fe-Mn family superoxide dismutase, partial [Acinetobacter baumannii]
DTLNTLLKDRGESESLEEVIRRAREGREQKLFNNAGQAWTHGYFWECMTPQRGRPDGELAAHIDQCFGGLEPLKSAFVAEGLGHFGSGWAWL